MMDELQKEKDYNMIFNAISMILQSRELISRQISEMKRLKVPVDEILHDIDSFSAYGNAQGFEIIDIIKKHCS